jgi:hypothetical protein
VINLGWSLSWNFQKVDITIPDAVIGIEFSPIRIPMSKVRVSRLNEHGRPLRVSSLRELGQECLEEKKFASI